MANIFILTTYRNRFKQIIAEFQTKTPKQRWQTIYYLFQKATRVIGLTILTTMENHWFSFVPIIVITIYFTSMVYTVWDHVQNQQYLEGVQCTCTIGLGFAVSCLSVYEVLFAKFGFNNFTELFKFNANVSTNQV